MACGLFFLGERGITMNHDKRFPKLIMLKKHSVQVNKTLQTCMPSHCEDYYIRLTQKRIPLAENFLATVQSLTPKMFNNLPKQTQNFYDELKKWWNDTNPKGKTTEEEKPNQFIKYAQFVVICSKCQTQLPIFVSLDGQGSLKVYVEPCMCIADEEAEKRVKELEKKIHTCLHGHPAGE
jgi:hypothetical protein